MCLSPLTLRKDSGKFIDVPCGKCMSCVASKRKDWSIRLMEEYRNSKTAYFVTITYSDDNLVFGDYGLPSLDKKGVQSWMKRLRETQEERIRYFIVGEYGTKSFRPHYHALLFNLVGTYNEVYEKIVKTWKLGQIHLGTVTEASVAYCTKYMIQLQLDDFIGIERPFNLMSRKPGIGHCYINNDIKQYHQNDDSRDFYQKYGKKSKLPRYYRNRLYNENQRLRQNVRKKLRALDSDAKTCKKEFNGDEQLMNRVMFNRKRQYQERGKKLLK